MDTGQSPAQQAPVRVFTETDFVGVDYEGAGLTPSLFADYKTRFIGHPVPPQAISDEALVGLGYDLPEPWVQFCIEDRMPNWG